ncbi:thermonuclease family protein [Phyllobacterium sp. P30BS-XVII]|uniref:thermonuclease family protein n=1 Tax=Phyllobacterium sp. P30BS-XVII TaxID=2587046 RepID=UPI0015F9C336|nr:thermonuclease family protein [Phyllobacterium sp. P30BS-XVII]MBA8904158.1 endonuclease YncB(thermonuclease family) [Phyllobacterium sp. P30BS-XVII]
MKRSLAFAAVFSVLAPFSASAQDKDGPATGASAQVFSIPENNVAFLTGDTWQQDGQKLRLYGIQSCIRGTTYTDKSGLKQDCGTVSLAMLAAMVRDTKPTCSPIAQLPAQKPDVEPTILVVCSSHVGDQSLDLGTALITQGFAFAAFSNDAKPVYMPYLVAEATAKQGKAGLWAYSDMPHPNLILFGAMQSKTQRP